MTGPPDVTLRRATLAVCVLRDLDLHPVDAGIVLEGSTEVLVSWQLVAEVLDGLDRESPRARGLLGDWFAARRFLADHSPTSLAGAVRPVGFPVGHPRHPGLGWVRTRVLGDALDLGVGLLGLDPAHPERVVPLPGEVAEHAGLDARQWWSGAREYLQEMGAMAELRWRRRPEQAIRPMGDCDVVTLLGSRVLRTAVAGQHQGMAPMAVPMRTRGWLDLSRIDPAFAVAAAAATPAAQRGFPRPLLVTSDEVVLVADGGVPARLTLLDTAPIVPSPRPAGHAGSIGA